ncbi:hypothetical protein A2U01_0066242 [Trifolium medium]|uniref:Uncharacterized protein n=1 Tax=Trifolium medium TaxID=97028 RepID=A0A392S7U7_9FABA|nr:hypothetical protein [Trifolium medium]
METQTPSSSTNISTTILIDPPTTSTNIPPTIPIIDTNPENAQNAENCHGPNIIPAEIQAENAQNTPSTSTDNLFPAENA